jgi:hypothetical protein
MMMRGDKSIDKGVVPERIIHNREARKTTSHASRLTCVRIRHHGGRRTGQIVRTIERFTTRVEDMGKRICHSKWRSKGWTRRYQTESINRYLWNLSIASDDTDMDMKHKSIAITTRLETFCLVRPCSKRFLRRIPPHKSAQFGNGSMKIFRYRHRPSDFRS